MIFSRTFVYDEILRCAIDPNDKKNISNPSFSAIFKLIVQEQFSKQFDGVANLKK